MQHKVSMPYVGPLVACPKNNKLRVWVRGRVVDGVVPKAGIAQVRKSGDASFGEPHIFPLYEALALVGVTDFLNLEPGQTYSYRVGILGNSAAPEDVLENDEFIWDSGLLDETLLPCVKMLPPVDARNIAFLAGSCNYRSAYNHTQRIFKIFDEVAGGSTSDSKAIDFALFMGDNIYIDQMADHLPGNEPDLADYYREYRRSYSKKYFRRAMRGVPSFFIFDDHEVRNDWYYDEVFNPGDDVSIERRSAKKDELEAGLIAYIAHQAILNPHEQLEDPASLPAVAAKPLPSDPLLPSGASNAVGQDYWYEFSCGIHKFFVLDVRGQRQHPGDESSFIGVRQFAALSDWLTSSVDEDGLRFIVSPIPLFPDVQNYALVPGGSEDKWGAYPGERLKLLRHIASTIQSRAVVLSGDVHISAVAKLLGPNGLTVHNVISSAINWYGGLQEEHFRTGELLAMPVHASGNETDEYRASFLPLVKDNGQVTSTVRKDNFAKIRISETAENFAVNVEFFKKTEGSEPYRQNFQIPRV